jgi:hypothetical protein
VPNYAEGRMDHIAILLSAILISVTFAPPAAAQLTESPDQKHGRFGDPMTVAPNLQGYLYGVVKGKTADSLTLDKTKFGVDKEIKLDKKTKYVRDGKPSTLSEIQAGDPVYVAVKTDKKSGDMTAKKILSGILPAPAH